MRAFNNPDREESIQKQAQRLSFSGATATSAKDFETHTRSVYARHTVSVSRVADMLQARYALSKSRAWATLGPSLFASVSNSAAAAAPALRARAATDGWTDGWTRRPGVPPCSLPTRSRELGWMDLFRTWSIHEERRGLGHT